MRHILTATLLIISLTQNFVCQIEDGWKGIKLFQTNRKQVEEILRKSIGDDGETNYLTDDALIHIIYSDTRCSDKTRLRNKYDVNTNTILEYRVILKEEIKLSDLRWKKNSYIREEDAHMKYLVHYRNLEDGISFSTEIKDGAEKVRSISYFPTKELSLKFLCASKK